MRSWTCAHKRMTQLRTIAQQLTGDGDSSRVEWVLALPYLQFMTGQELQVAGDLSCLRHLAVRIARVSLVDSEDLALELEVYGVNRRHEFVCVPTFKWLAAPGARIPTPWDALLIAGGASKLRPLRKGKGMFELAELVGRIPRDMRKPNAGATYNFARDVANIAEILGGSTNHSFDQDRLLTTQQAWSITRSRAHQRVRTNSAALGQALDRSALKVMRRSMVPWTIETYSALREGASRGAGRRRQDAMNAYPLLGQYLLSPWVLKRIDAGESLTDVVRAFHHLTSQQAKLLQGQTRQRFSASFDVVRTTGVIRLAASLPLHAFPKARKQWQWLFNAWAGASSDDFRQPLCSYALHALFTHPNHLHTCKKSGYQIEGVPDFRAISDVGDFAKYIVGKLRAEGLRGEGHAVGAAWLLDRLLVSRTPAQLVDGSARWHREMSNIPPEPVVEMEQCSVPTSFNFPMWLSDGAREIDGVRFTELHSPSLLDSESRDMRHCVASFSYAVASGNYVVFHCEHDELPPATLGLYIADHGRPVFSVAEVRSIENRVPALAIKRASVQLCDALNLQPFSRHQVESWQVARRPRASFYRERDDPAYLDYKARVERETLRGLPSSYRRDTFEMTVDAVQLLITSGALSAPSRCASELLDEQLTGTRSFGEWNETADVGFIRAQSVPPSDAARSELVRRLRSGSSAAFFSLLPADLLG